MEANANPRSDRGLATILGVAIATAALVWLVLEFRLRASASDRADAATNSSDAELNLQVAALERRVNELEASQRTLVSLEALRAARPSRPASGSERASDGGVAARAAQANSGALAAKPIEENSDVDERARRVGDASIARALEHAAALPSFDASPLPMEPAADAPAPHEPDPQANAAESSAQVDRDVVIAAFNQLLHDAGLLGWKLLAAQPQLEDHCLGAVVLARLSDRGTTIGSLSAARLTLQRDPVTGVAGFELTGAKGSEGGIEEAYEKGATHLDIPGILPLDLLAPCLRELFGVGTATDAAKALLSGDQIALAVNHVLALEKGVAMRVRSVDRLEERTLKKAVIDLAFDEHGDPAQTVLADTAWFEVDAAARYGELRCEGGEMVEKGLRRPLFRGKLRVPLRDIKPEQWQGMPAARAVPGS